MKRLKLAALSLFIVLSGGLAFVPLSAGAASFSGDACSGVNVLHNSASTTCSANTGKQLSGIIKFVLNLLSFIVGIAAVIMVIIGGFKYITANGDSSGIASARTTIIYALVGLVIVAMAQVLVQFVLANTNQAINNCPKITNCTAKN